MKSYSRVLFFSPFFWPSHSQGLNTAMQWLDRFAEQRSTTVDVLTFRFDSILKNQENFQRFNVIRMGYWFRFSKFFISVGYTLKYLSKILSADVVILSLPSVEGLELALLAKLLGKKIVGIYLYDWHMPRFWIARALRIQMRLCDSIIVSSSDYALHSLVLKEFEKKTHSVFPDVRDRPIRRSKVMPLMADKTGEIWLGYSGRVTHGKGLMKLARALVRYRNRNPEVKFRLVLVGPYGESLEGDQNTYIELLNFLELNQIPHRFYGNQESSDLPSFYTLMDLLVVPSTSRSEAFGLVQVEALMSGTPVIASDLPGVRVPVKMTGFGTLIDPGEGDRQDQELANAISLVLKKKYDRSVIRKTSLEILKGGYISELV